MMRPGASQLPKLGRIATAWSYTSSQLADRAWRRLSDRVSQPSHSRSVWTSQNLDRLYGSIENSKPKATLELPFQQPSHIRASLEASASPDERQPPRRPLRVGPLSEASFAQHTVTLNFAATDSIPSYTVTGPKAWLRDACQCPLCVDPDSGQKTYASTKIPLRIDQEQLYLRSQGVDENGSLLVEWGNDFLRDEPRHESVYTSDFLGSLVTLQAGHEKGRPRILWNNGILCERISYISYNDWIAGGEAFWAGMNDLARLGIVILTDVPQSETAVEDIGEKIGLIQHTFYGRTWDVVSKPQAENVAYTDASLGLHSDLLYMRDPPRIQLLHCLVNDARGGESVFSDGLKSAVDMRINWPDLCDILESHRVPYHYNKQGNHYSYTRPVFIPDGFGSFERIFWSPQFQAPFHGPKPIPTYDSDSGLRRRSGETDEAGKYHFSRWLQAARVWKQKIDADFNTWGYRLSPGHCVLFDNHRVLHGRLAFDSTGGHRHLKGAYVGDQVFTSRLRGAPAEAGLSWNLEDDHPSVLEGQQISWLQ